MFHNQLLHYFSLLPARTDANITGINYAVQIDLERCLISFQTTLRLCKEPRVGRRPSVRPRSLALNIFLWVCCIHNSTTITEDGEYCCTSLTQILPYNTTLQCCCSVRPYKCSDIIRETANTLALIGHCGSAT